MEYRRAARADLEAVLENRMEFVTSIRNLDDIEKFKQDNKHYLEKHIDKDDLRIFIAVENNEIISSCMACIYDMIPVPSSLNGKMAYIINVFTKENYRRQGHSEKLMRMLIDELKSCGVGKINLIYTDAGFTLYKKLGFTVESNSMAMKL